MGTAIPFALALTEQLAGKEKADALAKALFMRYNAGKRKKTLAF